MTGLLIGRENERARLHEWLQDPDIDVVVVRGPAGSGKTALVQSVLTDAVLTGTLVGSGKYAEGAGEAAFGPIMTALSSAVSAALEHLYDPRAGLQSLAESMRGSLPVLIGAGFRLAGLSAEQASAEPGRRGGAVARVTVAMLQVLRWLRGFDLPVIVFVDDWRRAPDDVRASLAALVTDRSGLQLTLVFGERDDRPLDGLATSPNARLLRVEGLQGQDAARLLGRAIGGDEAGEAALAWFGEDAPNLPFDLLEAARTLAETGAVLRDAEGWRVDGSLAGVLQRPEADAGAGRRLALLSPQAQHLAAGLALWGDAAPLEPLREAAGLDAPAFDAAIAALGGAGLTSCRQGRLLFNHDRLRAAVLAATADASAAEVASAMSDRLARGEEPPGDPVHTASLDLRIAGGLERADPGCWRDRFAQGARSARVRADPAAAARYAESAWALLRSPPDVAGEVRLVHDEAMLAAAERGEPAVVEARFRSLLSVCRTPAETGEAYRLCCHTAWLAGDEDASWRIAQEGMALFGVPPIARVGERRQLLLAAARWRLSRSLPSWLQADSIRPESVEPLGRVAETAGVLAYMRNPDQAALVALRVSARIKPRADHSPFWGSIEGFIRSMLGDPAGAARCGQLALAQLERGTALNQISAGSLYRIFAFGLGWSTPAHLLRRRDEDIRDKALAEGDLSSAATAIRSGVMVGWRAASSLTDLGKEVDEALEDCRRMMDAVQVLQVGALREAINLLQGRPDDLRRPPQLGRYPDGTPVAPLIEQELASIAGDWQLARSIAEANRAKLRTFRHHPLGIYARFHGAMAALKTGSDVPAGELRWLEKTARLNPADHRLKPRLIRAEMLRRRGAREAALAAYAEAVELGDLGACRLEAGLAAECARDAALEFGDASLADRYQRRAEAVWRAWGATAKLPAARAFDGAAQAQEVEAARAQVASAERENRAKSRLLADVAHELRTPLQGMQGLIDLAAEDGRALDMKALSGVLASLKTVIDDLSEYGALTSGGGGLMIRPVDLGELVRSEAALAGSLPRRRSIRIETAIDSAVPPRVDSDDARLRQVVRNLLSNAQKYGGGVVRVYAGPESNGDGSSFAVSVTDEGDGIPEADLLRLFEPFERGELGEGAADPGGLGLGLAVSRQVARRLGGDLTAQNRPEGGACFRFTFRATRSEPVPAESAPIRPLRVLVCDDVPLIRQVLTALLRLDGHAVVEASDGVEAMTAMAGDAFDLAIVDLAMPRMNGLEVLRAAHDDPPASGVPLLVLLTASAKEGLEEEAEAAGAAMVLRKPVSAADLRRAVQRLFTGRTDDALPQVELTLPPGLLAEARAELATQVARLLDSRSGDLTAAAAHRTAGLAAQFGWPELALACERLEFDLLADSPPEPAMEALRRAWEEAFPLTPLRAPASIPAE